MACIRAGSWCFIGEYARDNLPGDVIVATALICQQRKREIRRTDHCSGGGAC